MESRRIVLLTEGYLRGWLKFDNKTHLSRLREDFIISSLERIFIADSIKTKLLISSPLAAASQSRQAISGLFNDMKEWVELTLPYLAEKTRIKGGGGNKVSNDPAFWRKLLDQKKEEKVADKDTEYVPVDPTII